MTMNNSGQNQRPQKQSRRGSIDKVKLLIFAGFILLAGSIAVNALLFVDQNKLEDQVAKLKTPEGQQEVAQGEVEDLVSRVSEHLLLPDETPTIATVTDAEALKAEQPFFRDAQDGDRIMIYPEAERAILYSYSQDKLVNVGPYIQQGTGTNAGTTEGSAPADDTSAEDGAADDTQADPAADDTSTDADN